jgi:amidohydrolase
MHPHDAVQDRLDAYRERLITLSHNIHANPELGFQEYKAAGWLKELLLEAGLEVTAPVGGLDTAFEARAGTGGLHVAICAEYDCLPDIGHACGHNIIAAAAAAAGIALAPLADELGITVRVIGTPAEEGGGGKIILLNRGVFNGVHAAMMVHPSPVDILEPPAIAVAHIDVRYTGKEAHAASFPDMGINAADALTVAQVAIGLLRQHIRPSDKVHGIVTKGGEAPNIIPAHTSARYYIRALKLKYLEALREKVMRCFEAGALATGATLEVEDVSPVYAELVHDPDMAAAYKRHAEALGRVFLEFPNMEQRAGSTDMGNISLAMPSIQPLIGINSWPAIGHQPEFTEHCNKPDADKAVLDGALIMARTAIDIATDGRIRGRLMKYGR